MNWVARTGFVRNFWLNSDFRTSMKRKILPAAMILLLSGAVAASGDQRISLLPKLQPGKTLTYLVHCRGYKNVKTESSVAVPLAPAPSEIDADGLLRIEIVDVQRMSDRTAVQARGQILPRPPASADAATTVQKSSANPQNQALASKSIEFTISLDGSAEKVIGLEELDPADQEVWRAWLARFAAAWTIPAQRAKIGDKWSAEQPEPASSPIVALVWVRDSTYVRNEPCRSAQRSAAGEIFPSGGPEETCAVLLTTARLVQNSSSKDATPEDFKLHELKTTGTAKGANEIITYISLTTGLVVRATEDANQQMDVVVTRADGSNRVHYNVNAKSQSEVLLVTETPPSRP